MSALVGQLETLRRRHRRLARARRGCRAAWTWLAALWAAAMVDAGWTLIGAMMTDNPFAIAALPAGVRAGLGVGLLVGLSAAIGHCRLPREVRLRTLHDDARWCERRLGLANNVLSNAVALGRAAGDGSLVGELSRRAHERGESLADRIAPRALIDGKPVTRQAWYLAAVVGLWTVTMIAGPMATGHWIGPANLARLFDATGDHPPTAWLRIDVRLVNAPVAVGDDAMIEADTQGRPAELRVRFADGGTRSMWMVGAGRGAVMLHAVRERFRFVIEGGGARSRWRTVAPLALPRVLGVSVSVTPADGDGRYPWPGGREVIAPVGSTVEVAIQSNRADARIDHPRADGPTVALAVTAGEQSHTLGLVTPDGLRSRRKVELVVRGLSEAAIAEMIEGEAEATRRGALDAGTPTEAPGAAGTPKADQTQAPASTTGRGGVGGEGVEASPSGDGAREAELMRGWMVERIAHEKMSLPDAQSFADRAPARYREQVAEYFVRMTVDGAKERVPSND